MIPYVEIIDKYTLKPFTIVEPKECWFELGYNEIGECEVYCVYSDNSINSLVKGNYLKVPNKNYLWVITSVSYIYNAEGTRMIDAKGYEAKWILNKRIIMKPLQLTGDLKASLYKLINLNATSQAESGRALNGLNSLTISHVSFQAIKDTQASRQNLSDFINNMLKTYSCGSQIEYNDNSMNYYIYKGVDKSQSVVFSQAFDNLLSSSYNSSDDDYATYAYVVSKVEDVEYTNHYDRGSLGINRSEILVESNLSTKYTDTEGIERNTTPTSPLYQGWLEDEGHQEISKHIVTEEVKGVIDLEHSRYKFGIDFNLGDLIKIRDDYFKYDTTTRINKITFKQDSQGYGEEIDYGGN